MKTAAAVTVALVLGYIAGANAYWVSNAVYVSRTTGAPLWRVMDPLHRPWLATAIAPFELATYESEEDDEELARAVEAKRG